MALVHEECQRTSPGLDDEEGGGMVEDRKLAVLRAIVEDYVATEEPVGSRALVERHGLGVSPDGRRLVVVRRASVPGAPPPAPPPSSAPTPPRRATSARRGRL